MSAFQEGVEGLNLFLHLKHMQKAITVTVEINSEFQASLNTAAGTRRWQEAFPT